MAAGYFLNDGIYDKGHRTENELDGIFLTFLKKRGRKESTYKFALFKSIIDAVHRIPNSDAFFTFDELFATFAEIYWTLAYVHGIPQKPRTIINPETEAEKIIIDIAEKNHLKRDKEYSALTNKVSHELISRIKKKCSRYVFGSLYAETDKIFFSFSKREEWLKVNPAVVPYIKRKYEYLKALNYTAWAKYYASITIKKNNKAYYLGVLKRSFDSQIQNIEKVTLPVTVDDTPDVIAEGSSTPNYGTPIKQKVREVLRQYPDIGLYLAQISERVDERKEIVKDILDNSFWCRKEGSRYFYHELDDSDILFDTLFQHEQENYSEIQEDIKEYDDDYYRLLDDPETLIKVFKEKKQIEDTAKSPSDLNYTATNGNDNISTKSLQKRWEREEVIILVAEYFRNKNKSQREVMDSYCFVSEFLRKREKVLTGHEPDDTFRNYAGIRMQTARIRCLDPETDDRGMQGTKFQKEIVKEYLENPNAILAEAERIYKKYE